jgi:CSLREA domain-containing protein
MNGKRIAITLLFVLSAGVLSGCGLIEDILAGFAAVCETDPLVVTKTADTDDGICTGDDCSLREAVITSNSCAGRQTIEIPAGTYNLTLTGTGEDQAHSGDLDITDTAALVAVGGEVIIDGGAGQLGAALARCGREVREPDEP